MELTNVSQIDWLHREGLASLVTVISACKGVFRENFSLLTLLHENFEHVRCIRRLISGANRAYFEHSDEALH